MAGHVLRSWRSKRGPFAQAEASNSTRQEASQKDGDEIHHCTFLCQHSHWDSARFMVTFGIANSLPGSFARLRRLSPIITTIKTEARPNPTRKNRNRPDNSPVERDTRQAARVRASSAKGGAHGSGRSTLAAALNRRSRRLSVGFIKHSLPKVFLSVFSFSAGRE